MGPEQKYLSSDPRWEWSAVGPLFKLACFDKFQIGTLASEKSHVKQFFLGMHVCDSEV